MPESSVRTAANLTGQYIRTRQRTINGTAVEEPYTIIANERVVSARGWVASFRTPSRAVASQPIFALWNGSTNLLAIRRLTMEADAGAALAQISPYARLYRISAAPTGGSTLTKGQQDTGETTSAGIVATGDASADGTNSTTPLAATVATGTSHLWQQTIPRLHTAVGWVSPAVMSLLPDDAELNREDPLVLRPSQGVLVRVEAAATMVAGTNTAGFMFYTKCVFGEFTLP